MNSKSMNTMIARLSALAAATLFAASAAQAQLSITNAGFESPEITSTNGANGTVDDWVKAATDGTSQTLENGGTAVTGLGITATEGDQFLRLIESPTTGDNVIVRQDLGNITQNEIDNFSLQFDIGRDDNEEIPVTSIGMFFFDSGGTQIGGHFENGLAAPASGTFETRTIALSTFTSNVTGASAGNLAQLRLVARPGDFAGLGSQNPNDGISESAGGGTARNNVYFDNLQTVPVPEPGHFALLGGLLALGAVFVRRTRS